MLYETVMGWMAEQRSEGIAIGEQRGEKRGFDRGAHEKAVQTARSFLAMGLSAQQVAQGVGLPVDEVQALL